MKFKSQHLGLALAVSLYILYSLMFVLRMLGQPQAGHLLATLQFLGVPALIYLLVNSHKAVRPALHAIQAGLMLIFLVVEFLLDYWPGYEFRQTGWMVITYVTFYFAATGGVLGLTAGSERRWAIAVVGLYLVMAALAFISRAVTGI